MDTILLHAGDAAEMNGKVVIVAAVVREEDDPRKCVPAGMRYTLSGRKFRARAHRSYLVRAVGSNRLTWPAISCLHRLQPTPSSDSAS